MGYGSKLVHFSKSLPCASDLKGIKRGLLLEAFLCVPSVQFWVFQSALSARQENQKQEDFGKVPTDLTVCQDLLSFSNLPAIIYFLEPSSSSSMYFTKDFLLFSWKSGQGVLNPS